LRQDLQYNLITVNTYFKDAYGEEGIILRLDRDMLEVVEDQDTKIPSKFQIDLRFDRQPSPVNAVPETSPESSTVATGNGPIEHSLPSEGRPQIVDLPDKLDIPEVHRKPAIVDVEEEDLSEDEDQIEYNQKEEDNEETFYNSSYGLVSHQPPAKSRIQTGQPQVTKIDSIGDQCPYCSRRSIELTFV
jgi:hypothetical protein